MDETTDLLVAAALRTLEPPPPRPGFWDELEELLAQEAPARSRPRRRLLAGLAVAASVLAAFAFLADRPGDFTLVGPAPNSTPQGPATADLAADAVRRWVAAVGAGDADAAWAMVGPQSRAAIGGRAAFDQLMASALREGWGAWASAASVEVRPYPMAPGVFAVMLDGTVTQEGETRRRVLALAVRVTDEPALVEPFVPGRSAGPIETGTTVAAGDPIRVHVPADATGYVVCLDGAVVPDAALDRAADGSIRAVRPEPPLAPGDHTILVGYALPSGTITLDVLLFRTG